MYKLCEYDAIDEHGRHIEVVSTGNGLRKVASDEYSPEIRKFAEQVQPHPDKVVVLVNAMGAGEYWGCFPAGTPILMADGSEKSIEDIQAGERVFTHAGTTEKVLIPQVYYGKEKRTRLHIEGLIDPIECTDNHPFWAVSKESPCSHDKYIRCLPPTQGHQSICGRSQSLKSKCAATLLDLSPEWIEASELEVGNWAVFELPQKNKEASISLAEARLIGLLLAEGCYLKYGKKACAKNRIGIAHSLSFYLGEHEETTLVREVEELATRLGWKTHRYHRPEKSFIRVDVLCGSKKAESYRKMFGEYAHGKKVPLSFLSEPLEVQCALLSGILDGDGCFNLGGKENRCIIRVASLELARAIQMLSWSLGSPASLIRVSSDHSAKTNRDHYQVSMPLSRLHRLAEFSSRFSVKELQQTTKARSFVYQNRVYLPIRKIDSFASTDPVYNLEVENEHSYVAGGVSVHNSNRNADYFPVAALKQHYNTFYNARAYKHHINKDPNRSYGRVLFANYNPRMNRVELAIEYDKKKASDIVERIDSGDLQVSMGCKCDYDVCFAPDTLIETPFGQKEIEDISEGDYVISHTGKRRKVIETFRRKYSGKKVSIKPFGVPDNIECTGNHPFLVCRSEQFKSCHGTINGKRRRHTPVDGRCVTCGKIIDLDPEWAPARSLKKGDYLVYPIHRRGPVTSLSPSDAYSMGLYAGDGSLQRYRDDRHKTSDPYAIRVSCNPLDPHIQSLAEHGFSVHKTRGKNEVVAVKYGTKFAQACLREVGTGSKIKFIGSEILNATEEARLSFIGGLIDSDGSQDHNKKKGQIRVVVTSKDLALSARRILLSCGIICTVSSHKYISQWSSGIAYQLSISASYSEVLSRYSKKCRPHKAANGSKAIIDNGLLYAPIESIDHEEVEDYEVFNLSVDIDESYVANGYAVHNCSICGHQAKNVKEYCDHLKNHANEIFENGKQACAITPHPNFFDISAVFRGADRTALQLAKIAGDDTVVPSAVLGEQFYGDQQEVESYEDELDKEASLEDMATVSFVEQYMPLIEAYEPDIDRDTLNKIAEEPLEDIFSTFTTMGFVMKPREYQRIALIKAGMADQADDLEDRGFVIQPGQELASDVKDEDPSLFNEDKASPKIAMLLGPYMEKRSAVEPMLSNRIMQASKFPPPVLPNNELSAKAEMISEPAFGPLLIALSLGYMAYRKVIPEKMMGRFERMLAKNPKLALPILAGGAGLVYGATSQGIAPKQPDFAKTSSAAYLVPIPAAYVWQAHVKRKLERGEPVGNVGIAAARHPFTTGMTASGALMLNALRRAKKAGQTTPGIYERLVGGVAKAGRGIGKLFKIGSVPGPSELRKLAFELGDEIAKTMVFGGYFTNEKIDSPEDGQVKEGFVSETRTVVFEEIR